MDINELEKHALTIRRTIPTLQECSEEDLRILVAWEFAKDGMEWKDAREFLTDLSLTREYLFSQLKNVFSY